MKSTLAFLVLILTCFAVGAAALRAPRQLPNETTTSPGTTPDLVIVYWTVPAGGGLLLLGVIFAAVSGCIVWRCRSGSHDNKHARNKIVVSDSFVLENRITTHPEQVQDMHECSPRVLHQQNVITAQIERMPDSMSNSSMFSQSLTTYPSSGDSYSGHNFHPSHPTQAVGHNLHPSQAVGHNLYSAQAVGHNFHPSPPTDHSTLVCDHHKQHSRGSFRSNPEELINGHPRLAANMNKSHSYNEALNKSFGVTTIVNIGAGVTLATTVTSSNSSLCSSALHAPVQEGPPESPGSGRMSIFRRFFGSFRGSIRSRGSNHSGESEVYEAGEGTYTHYETPV